MALVDPGRRDVSNLDGLASLRRATHHALPFVERRSTQSLDQGSVDVTRRSQMELLGDLIVFVDRTAISAGKLPSTLGNRVEHRFQVQRRAYGLADLAKRRQLLN